MQKFSSQAIHSADVKFNVIVDWMSCQCLCAVPNDPRRVIVTKLTLVVEGRPDVDIDLTGTY